MNNYPICDNEIPDMTWKIISPQQLIFDDDAIWLSRRTPHGVD